MMTINKSCTTYSPDPANCVKWDKAMDRKYISGVVIIIAWDNDVDLVRRRKEAT